MISRLVKDRLHGLLTDYPAVALLGPRQVGKTTLAKSLSGVYFDLEQTQERLRLEIEWEQRSQDQQLLILDEVQAAPDIFPRLRGVIDRDRQRNGRFLLLGSTSPALMRQAGESLAGRLAICELTPFLAREFPDDQWDLLWRCGGYPDGGVLRNHQYPDWQKNYLTLLAQRDLPQWGLPAQPVVTQRLFRMLAAAHGQAWNASQIGKSMGLSYHTVNTYVNVLENAFLIRRLPAYAGNLKKRLVKSPKLYWRDSGLLHALLGLEADDDLLVNPWVGHSWEGWIIEQILNCLQTRGQSFDAYYLRTSDQQEIDLLLKTRGKLWAFEIKLTSAPDIGDLRRLKAVAGPVDADFCAIISRIASPSRGAREASLNLAAALDWLTEA